MTRTPVPIAVLASGGGTTLQALIDASLSGALPVRIARVVTDRPHTGAEERSRRAGLPVTMIDRREYRTSAESTRAQRAATERTQALPPPDIDALSHILSAAIPPEVQLVVLAGFLSIIGEPLLSRFSRRMINIHPSLLPRHGGAGMYGTHVHEAVIAAGDRETGCTVHFVDAGTDTGEIILHRRIPVLPGDTPALLAARLRPVEHRAIVEAVLTLVQTIR